MEARRAAVDLVAAAAGLAASWIVADLIVAAHERRRPLIADLKNLPKHLTQSERMAGVFHIGQGYQDGMAGAYHINKVVMTRSKMFYGMQAAFCGVRIIYHVVAYCLHHRDSK